MPDAFGSQKKVSDLPEVELGAVVSCRVVAGNQIQTLARGLTSPAPGMDLTVSMTPWRSSARLTWPDFVVYLYIQIYKGWMGEKARRLKRKGLP